MYGGSEARVMVIGIGNEDRGDDGVGRRVAQAVRARRLPDLEVVEATGDGASLLELWRQVEVVLLVDAVQTGAAPGTVTRIDLNAQAVPTAYDARSSHGFGVASAIEMTRTLQRMPVHFILFGIEAEMCDLGASLSTAVQQAIPVVVAQVLAEVAHRR